jgi:PII-like signaling protein
MRIARDAVLLRIFIGENDKAGLRLSQDLPLIIEIVDNEDQIAAFVAAIEPIIGSGLVTTEKVQVIRYGEGGPM